MQALAQRAPRNNPASGLLVSLVLHGLVLVSLPGTLLPDAIDDDLVAISAELLRSGSAQPSDRPEEPPATPRGGTAEPAASPLAKAPPGPARPPPAKAPPAEPSSASARTKGLAAKLPTNVRFAVLARPAMLAGSPHEQAGRETIRRAVGLRLQQTEDGGVLDPLQGLDEIVVVTSDPFSPGNFSAAASGTGTTVPPVGYKRRGDDLIHRADAPPDASTRPAPRFAWRNRLLALADPVDGSPRPTVALVGSDLTSLTFGRLDIPIPPRLELVAIETPEHGAITRARAIFDSPEDAARALAAWREELARHCRSIAVALIGLGGACRRIELEQEGPSVKGALEANQDEVQSLMGILQAAMRGRRRSRR